MRTHVVYLLNAPYCVQCIESKNNSSMTLKKLELRKRQKIKQDG